MNKSATTLICGYIVVRKPHLDLFHPPAGGPSDHPRKCVNGIWYAGTRRKAWVDLVEPYYEGRLPLSIRDDYRLIVTHPLNGTELEATRDQQLARRLLEYCNEQSSTNELIAIDLEALSDTDYRFEVPSEKLVFLGYDPILRGGWSLLAEGYFFRPDLFEAWARCINQNGLFDVDDEAVSDYIRAYMAASAQDLTDPIEGLGEEKDIDRVAVFRVSEDR